MFSSNFTPNLKVERGTPAPLLVRRGTRNRSKCLYPSRKGVLLCGVFHDCFFPFSPPCAVPQPTTPLPPTPLPTPDPRHRPKFTSFGPVPTVPPCLPILPTRPVHLTWRSLLLRHILRTPKRTPRTLLPYANSIPNTYAYRYANCHTLDGYSYLCTDTNPGASGLVRLLQRHCL